MKNALGISAVCVTLMVGLAACGDDDSGVSSATTAPATSTTLASTDAAVRQVRTRRGKGIKVMRSRYGRMLFDARARAIYLFTREARSRSRGYGPCAVAWPPVYTRGRPRALSGTDADLLGTTKRQGGRRQVTYNDHPLYYYVTDTKPGQITCQDITEFGGTWLVVDPRGNAIQ
jgi:predicted lipoprotein with Yx(FWY)xxD motif